MIMFDLVSVPICHFRLCSSLCVLLSSCPPSSYTHLKLGIGQPILEEERKTVVVSILAVFPHYSMRSFVYSGVNPCK